MHLCEDLRIRHGQALPNPLSALSAAVVGFLCYGVSLIFFVLALRQLGTARTAAYFSVAPFFGAAVAIAFFNEPVSGQLIVAGLLMASGVSLAACDRTTRTRACP
jgi:drug/metabolite transporter (DMT)-like permease